MIVHKLFKLLLTLSVISSLVGGTLAYASTSSFSDVPSTHWAYSPVTQGVKDGVITGYSDGTFKPNNFVTEAEFYALLVRSSTTTVSTTGAGKWSDPYCKVVKELNYPTATNRDGQIDRTRVAEIIVGIQGYNYSGNDAIQFMLATGLTSGVSSATIKGYKDNTNLTRAQAVSFIASVKKVLPSPNPHPCRKNGMFRS